MSRDRLITLAGALAALFLVAVLFFNPSGPVEKGLSRPVSTDQGSDGYLGLSRWLAWHGIPVVSLRHRFDWLTTNEFGAPSAGNLLVTTVPQLHPARYNESQQLKEWIRAGNTLLILSAWSDTPAWASRYSFWDVYDPIDQMTGLQLSFDDRAADEASTEEDMAHDPQISLQEDDAEPSDKAASVLLVPAGPHPLFHRVGHLEAQPDSYYTRWQVEHPSEGILLALLRELDTDNVALWQARFGDGQILLSAFAGLIGNGQLSSGDNARWFANLVEYALGPGGMVIFDDMHQGLSVLYDPEAFYADPRLHSTLLFVLGFWLIYVLGATNRLSPAQLQPAPARTEKDFIQATGGFFARTLGARHSASGLFKHFFNDVRLRFGMPPNGQPVWGKLEASPRVPREWLQAARGMHERLAAGQDIDIVRLHALTRKIKDRLL